MTAAAEAFDAYFERFIELRARDNPLYAHVAYHFGYGDGNGTRRGKRLRPRMVLAAAEACGGSVEHALPAATAVELLHNYSLIHDDIEDGDRLRHGREVLWSKFGLANGINAGDVVGALAQLSLSDAAAQLGAQSALAMMTELARAHVRMCEGQSLDLALETDASASPEAYVDMIAGKTAALFACAGALGSLSALSASANVDACRNIGHRFGLGFQIQDDVAGVWADSRVTGKAAGADIARRKKSYPIVWAAQQPGVGAELRALYASQPPKASASDERIRALLDRCGARDASLATAQQYFDDALAIAQPYPPLVRFIQEWQACS